MASSRRIHALSTASGSAAAGAGSSSLSHNDDVVIVGALRTPFTKARRGALKDTPPDRLLSCAMRAVLDQTGFPAEKLGDICVGNVLQPGAGAVMARVAQFEAGIPKEVPVSTVNRQCSSGLQALMNVVGGILAGSYDAALGCGVESMSMRDMQDPSNLPDIDFDVLSSDQLAADCLIPMGITSENVAEKYGVTRAQQDGFAARSQSKAAAAQQAGTFKDEIAPVSTAVEDSSGSSRPVTVDADDGIRGDTTAEKLSKLRTVFKSDGTTTAGNSSQVSDGAAAVLVMRRWLAKEHNLPVLGVVRSYSVVGVEPKLMGVGPAAAIPSAVAKAGLTLEDIDVFEINEAFASQAVYCVRELGIPLGKVNPNGGAIALGHPLGCTGARMVGTLLYQLKRTKARYGVVSMCIGSGMGAAAVFEHEAPSE